jgi:hypothetical protein
MRKVAYLAATLLAVSACTASQASNAGGGANAGTPAATDPVWDLKWQANFRPVPAWAVVAGNPGRVLRVEGPESPL